MSAPVPYFEVVRQMPNAFNYRLRLVTPARQHGIKPAARAFRTTVPTVRKWLRRHQAQGLKGLQELSRAPLLPAQNPRGAGRTGGRSASSVAHLRGPALEARVGAAALPHGHRAHPAPARPA